METVTTIILGVLAAASIPSAVFAAYIRRMEKKLDEKDKAREDHEVLILKSINASIALGEATAEAVARIPDANCNGDMHAALEYASSVKRETQSFIEKQGIHAVV